MGNGARVEPGNTSHWCEDKIVVDGNLHIILLKSKKDFLESLYISSIIISTGTGGVHSTNLWIVNNRYIHVLSGHL